MAENILENFKNSNILSEELREKLSDMVGKYQELNEKEKGEFQKHAKEAFKDTVKKYSTIATHKKFVWLASSYIILLVAIFIGLSVLVFFGYKLYKSMADRERKREEKRRLKQMKKRK